MTVKWLKGCLVCNADLVTTVRGLVEEGMTKNQVWDRLVEDQQEELGEVLYSKNALKFRYHRNTTSKTATAKKSIETILANEGETLQEVASPTELVTVFAAPEDVVAVAAFGGVDVVVPIPAPTPVMPDGYTPKFNRQSSDRIEWAAWSWNPVTGCKHGCKYCYARDIATRYPENYPKGFKPHFRPERLSAPRGCEWPCAP